MPRQLAATVSPIGVAAVRGPILARTIPHQLPCADLSLRGGLSLTIEERDFARVFITLQSAPGHEVHATAHVMFRYESGVALSGYSRTSRPSLVGHSLSGILQGSMA